MYLSLAPRMQQSKQNAAFLSVVIDGRNYEACVANAGLIAPLLWRDGNICYIESFGLPLGALHTASYTQQIIALQSGDCMLLCSDGLVEAKNSVGQLWSFECLEETFAAAADRAPEAVIEMVLAAVRAFTAGAPQHDDMTLVVLQVLPN